MELFRNVEGRPRLNPPVRGERRVPRDCRSNLENPRRVPLQDYRLSWCRQGMSGDVEQVS